MIQETQHAPAPLPKLKLFEVMGKKTEITIGSEGGISLHHLYNGEDYAPQIVRACNSHDALVKALKFLIYGCEELEKSEEIALPNNALHLAKEALKQAGAE